MSGAAAEHIAADASWRFVSRQSPILAGEPPAVGQGRAGRFQVTVSTAIDNLGLSIVMGPFASGTQGLFVLEAGRLGEVDFEPVAFALVATGHFGAGVAEMVLDMGLLDLGRGGQSRAPRMAAKGRPAPRPPSGPRAGRPRARRSSPGGRHACP